MTKNFRCNPESLAAALDAARQAGYTTRALMGDYARLVLEMDGVAPDVAALAVDTALLDHRPAWG
jgi:hypothetical protein